MFKHDDIWIAIDKLAEVNGYSSSGLAKKAGLDPTSFNKSKRLSANGKPRWPSTESIAKILSVTGTTMLEFTTIIDQQGIISKSDVALSKAKTNTAPLITTNNISQPGCFDKNGAPVGKNWSAFTLPKLTEHNTGQIFAVEISTSSMEPLYRKGDTLLVSRDNTIKKGDRVLVKTKEGEILIKELRRNTADRLELMALNTNFDDYNLATEEIKWISRILWVSQ